MASSWASVLRTATGTEMTTRTAIISSDQEGSTSGWGSISQVNRMGDSRNGELHSNKSVVW